MRLIDGDALQLRVNLKGTNKFGMLDENIRDFIDAAPTVDAEVVTRCKDCRYADGKRELAVEKRYAAGILFCRNSDLCGDEPLAMWPNNFCSYGEPKEG